jgi:hypothetical protein
MFTSFRLESSTSSVTGCAIFFISQHDVHFAGGEGAPLSALADGLVFARAPRPCAILNLGGLANLTFLGAEDDEIFAFDTGPAGSLLDGLPATIRFLDPPQQSSQYRQLYEAGQPQ